MEVETNVSALVASLSASSSVVHKKALIILQTILKTLHTQISNQSEANVNLIVLTVLYKQYKQAVETQSIENSISYLLLIQRLLPQVNTASLEEAGVLLGIKELTFKVLSSMNKQFLGFRYCLSVLTELVLVSKSEQTQYNLPIVQTLLQIVLKSNKNVERKQAGKNLRLILDKYPTFGVRLGTETKQIVEQNTSGSIYLHSIASVVGFFPAVLLNDICYLLRPYLRVEQDTYSEQFISEAYFFLDTVLDKQLITGQISEQVLKELVHNIPIGGDNKIIYGYLQCLHSSFLTLCRVNSLTSQRYLSSVVSVISEMLLTSGKVPKQAEGILKSIISNSVEQSLWLKTQQDFDLGSLEIDGQSNSFKKLVAMLQDLLSTRYDQRRVGSFDVLEEFFSRLDNSAFSFTKPLVIELIKQRERFQVGEFNILFASVIEAFGHETILQFLPLSFNGDPTSETFETENNLWLLEILAKTAPAGTFQLFVNVLFPLLKQVLALKNKTQNPLRKTIYGQISHRFWAILPNCASPSPQKKVRNFEECLQFIEANLVDQNQQLPLVLNGLVELLVQQAVNPAYFATKSEKFIPTLAKILDLSKEKEASNILKAITSLSNVCPASYIDRVFLKNISKLYTEKLNGTLLENEALNSKNIEILMAISHGVNFKDTSVHSFNGQSYSKLECVVELLRVLLEEKSIFQKKAYKYLGQCLHYMPQGFISQAKDLLDKEVDILPSSRSYRLAVLHILWFDSGFSEQNCDIQNVMGFVKQYLPEIILMLKEPNQKVRRLAHGMLVKILQTMNNFGVIESFLQMISAGLASVSVSGKVDALTALTLSLGSLDADAHAEFARELTDVILVLLHDAKPDIIKAVIGYLKKYIFYFPSSKASLPQIMKAIFETDQNSRLHVLHLIKRLLLKLVKRDSKDTIMKIIPTQHQRLLKSLMREEGKKKREQRRKQLTREQHKKNRDDSDSEEEQAPTPKFNLNAMEIEQTIQNLKKTKNNLLLKYDLDQQKFHFVDGKQKPAKKKKSDEENKDEDVAFINGRLVVKQSGGQRVRPAAQMQQSDDEKQQTRPNKKIHKSYESALHQIKQSGSSYKAARAKGDLRIKNKPEPHAFIQLNPKALNKRYKQKADKVFQNFFETKEGGLKGLKARMLKKK